MPNSLICTLPQTLRPPSACLEHSPPYTYTPPHMLAHVDEFLASHVQSMLDRERKAAADSATRAKSNLIATFSVGDLVRLKYGLATSSLANATNWNLCEMCLGDSSWDRIGQIMSVTPSATTAPGNAVVQVLSLPTDMTFDYLTSDLTYADHSTDGAHDIEDIATVTTIIDTLPLTATDLKVSSGSAPHVLLDNSSFTCWTSAPTSPPHDIEVLLPRGFLFHALEVQLNDHGGSSLKAVDLLAGKSSSELHIVKSVEFPVTCAWQEVLSVYECHPMQKWNIRVVKLSIRSNRVGNTSKVTSIRVLGNHRSCPLAVGEQVTLAPSFSANGGDGWCLGTVDKPRVGTVVAVSTGDDVLSDPFTDASEVLVVSGAMGQGCTPAALYRSSWLRRTPREIGSFSKGQRVQLNRTAWLTNSGEARGKCLGTPADALYGVVCGVGPVRHSVQRNIEVMVINDSDEGSKRKSLYPAYLLSDAIRSTCMTTRDRETLVPVVAAFLSSAFPKSQINTRNIVEQCALQVPSIILILYTSRHFIPVLAFCIRIGMHTCL
jgi:hypothetical protein